MASPRSGASKSAPHAAQTGFLDTLPTHPMAAWVHELHRVAGRYAGVCGIRKPYPEHSAGRVAFRTHMR